MAIIFKERLKTQYFLFFLLLALLIIGIFIIGRNFFLKEEAPELDILPKPIRKIEIDFKLLESRSLETLYPIEKIIPLETGIGRENPFSPIQQIKHGSDRTTRPERNFR